MNLFRAKVTSIELERVLAEAGRSGSEPSITLMVNEVLNPSTAFNENDVGRELVGRYQGAGQPFHCSSHDLDFYTPAVGDSVFAAFSARQYGLRYCFDYPSCETPCSRRADFVSYESCRHDCAFSCEPDRTSDPILASPLVWPWADPVQLDAMHQVSLNEVAELSNIDACFKRYPPPEMKPCMDYGGPTKSSGCSMTTEGSLSPWNSAWSVASVVAFAFHVARRRRRN